MDTRKTLPVPVSVANSAWINEARYEALYKESIEKPEDFWFTHGKRLAWIKPYTRIKNVSWDPDDFRIRWFDDGTLNVCANCLDRHVEVRGDKIALIWEANDPAHSLTFTYRDLLKKVCRLASAMKTLGLKKGDRICIYMPMIPEAAIAMLACARIGAIHSVVFGGFSPDSLANRIQDSGCSLVITADQGRRGERFVSLKDNTDKALESCPSVQRVIVVRHTSSPVSFHAPRDVWYHEIVEAAADDCPPEEVEAEHPLFILYTSGSTGKPKGVLHTSGGYLVYASLTHQYVFDYHDDDIYWCTADIGWITGHSYGIYGPLANGATTLMFEGIPSYPDVSRFWQVIDKHRVSIFYTAPTALRALMREGNDPVARTNRQSLRILGTVGEPINPEAWAWYYDIVGEQRCPIVDTWWQTETGGIMITPLPGAIALKPGSATRPFFGVQPILVNSEGHALTGEAEGNLCLADSWPGQMRTVYGDHQRFIQTYFSLYKGYYFTGDGCRRDADGYYWITGRVDDVLNVSGHRIGTAEIESSLVAHPKVAEAAVVGYPHHIKGQGIYAYITLLTGERPSQDLYSELIQWVRKDIGAIAQPDVIQWALDLPKTRSGKIMRRILRKIAEDNFGSLGDTSTLADPSVVDTLIKDRRIQKSTSS